MEEKMFFLFFIRTLIIKQVNFEMNLKFKLLIIKILSNQPFSIQLLIILIFINIIIIIELLSWCIHIFIILTEPHSVHPIWQQCCLFLFSASASAEHSHGEGREGLYIFYHHKHPTICATLCIFKMEFNTCSVEKCEEIYNIWLMYRKSVPWKLRCET